LKNHLTFANVKRDRFGVTFKIRLYHRPSLQREGIPSTATQKEEANRSIKTGIEKTAVGAAAFQI